MSQDKQYPELEGKRLAQELTAFLATPLGEHLIKQMSLQYNSLHQQAEGESLSTTEKAFKVERAAGVKWTIDYIMTRISSLEKGVYDKKPVD